MGACIQVCWYLLVGAPASTRPSRRLSIHRERSSDIACTTISQKYPIYCIKVSPSDTLRPLVRNILGPVPREFMESLATSHNFATLNCRSLSSDIQQSALSRLLSYFHAPFAALQETRLKDRPVINVGEYAIYCGNADDRRVGGCAIAVRKDFNGMIEEFG